MNQDLSFRKATIEDSKLILHFIKEIATYEKMQSDVKNTEEEIKEKLFNKHYADVIFLMKDNKEIGYALYFFTYSTFTGKPSLYLEDLFIYPEYRKNGYGKKTFKHLIKIALDNDCERMEWCCLNWNKPSIEFYLNLKATPMKEWTTYRLTSDNMKEIIAEE